MTCPATTRLNHRHARRAKGLSTFPCDVEFAVEEGDCPKTKTYIVRQLVKEILVSPEAVFINFMTGSTYVGRILEGEFSGFKKEKGAAKGMEDAGGGSITKSTPEQVHAALDLALALSRRKTFSFSFGPIGVGTASMTSSRCLSIFSQA